MRPIEFLREARQETCGGDAACGPSADVGHVGKVAAQLFLIIVPQRHAPHPVVRRIAGLDHFVGEGIFIRVHAGCNRAKRDDTSAGQRGDVDHGARLITLRVGEGVAQNQPTFGIGVENFNGLAGHTFNDVTGTGCRAIGHVFASGNQADDVERQLHQRDGFHRAKHATGAAHVVLHLVHVRCGLDGDTAGVEGDAFADENGRFITFLAAFMLQDNKLRRVTAAFGNRQE